MDGMNHHSSPSAVRIHRYPKSAQYDSPNRMAMEYALRSDSNGLPTCRQQIGFFQAGGNFDGSLVRARGADDT